MKDKEERWWIISSQSLGAGQVKRRLSQREFAGTADQLMLCKSQQSADHQDLHTLQALTMGWSLVLAQHCTWHFANPDNQMIVGSLQELPISWWVEPANPFGSAVSSPASPLMSEGVAWSNGPSLQNAWSEDVWGYVHQTKALPSKLFQFAGKKGKVVLVTSTLWSKNCLQQLRLSNDNFLLSPSLELRP